MIWATALAVLCYYPALLPARLNVWGLDNDHFRGLPVHPPRAWSDPLVLAWAGGGSAVVFVGVMFWLYCLRESQADRGSAERIRTTREERFPMRVYTQEEVETAQALIASADREFGDYSRTDLLLDNMRSLRNVEDARGLLAGIEADLRPGYRPQ